VSTDQPISIHLTPGPDGARPIEICVEPDGNVRIGPRVLRLDGEMHEIQGWNIRLGAAEPPPAGPELLVFHSAAETGKPSRCPLPTEEGQIIVVGRSRRACDVVVADEHVSRMHMRIIAGVNGHLVEDAQSRWGTYVNGEKLTSRHPLTHGDEIRIGTSTIRYLTHWDNTALRPVQFAPGDFEADTFGSSVTVDESPVVAFEHVERSVTHRPGRRDAAHERIGVPPLWIGIGIGLTMALVAMVIYTLVIWLWPEW